METPRCAGPEVKFEVVAAAQVRGLQPHEYGYAVYSGGKAVAELDGPEQLGTDWQEVTASGSSITAKVSGAMEEVSFRIKGPTGGGGMKVTRMRMVVEYDANRPRE